MNKSVYSQTGFYFRSKRLRSKQQFCTVNRINKLRPRNSSWYQSSKSASYVQYFVTMLLCHTPAHLRIYMKNPSFKSTLIRAHLQNKCFIGARGLHFISCVPRTNGLSHEECDPLSKCLGISLDQPQQPEGPRRIRRREKTFLTLNDMEPVFPWCPANTGKGSFVCEC